MTKAQPPFERRPRYRGTHPRRFEQRYKELSAADHPGIAEHVRAQGRTPAGMHVPVLADELLAVLDPRPGEIVVDCTLGYGGHAERFLERIGPAGKLIGMDLDAEQLARTAARLRPLHASLSTCACNFAGVARVLQREHLEACDILFADLGVSSMQLDDPARGFSYKHDGPLDLRMDRRRRRTAADLVHSLGREELADAFHTLADEPDAERLARRIVEIRAARPLRTTRQLSDLVLQVKGIPRRAWKAKSAADPQAPHPAAQVFQALRILVNDELACLKQLLRQAPYVLGPGGRIAVISFHSGEDRIVEQSFAEGLARGLYEAISESPIRPGGGERRANPRSASAILRWARRSRAPL